LSGDADVTLRDEVATASAGTWIHMAAQLPHSIRAKTPVVMLLSLVKGGA
jgi:quercetin dioxygenase-like cupin family protein